MSVQSPNRPFHPAVGRLTLADIGVLDLHLQYAATPRLQGEAQRLRRVIVSAAPRSGADVRRPPAARAAAEVHREEVQAFLATLATAAQESDWEMRLTAVRSLVQAAESPTAQTALLSCLEDPCLQVRCAAAPVLAARSLAVATRRFWLARLPAAPAVFRAAVVKALAAVGDDPEVQSLFFQLWRDPAADIRQLCATVMARFAAVPPIFQRLLECVTSADWETRAAAATALAGAPAALCVSPLYDCLKDDHEAVRAAAVRSLAQVAPDGIDEVLRMHATDGAEVVRIAVVHAAAVSARRRTQNNFARISSLLLTRLQEDTPSVRLAVLQVLPDLPGGGQLAYEAAAPFLNDSDVDVQAAAEAALLKCVAHPPVRNFLLQTLNPQRFGLYTRWELREAAVRALAPFAHALSVRKVLAGCVTDDRREVRLAAVQVLARFAKRHWVRKVLWRAVADESELVCITVLRALAPHTPSSLLWVAVRERLFAGYPTATGLRWLGLLDAIFDPSLPPVRRLVALLFLNCSAADRLHRLLDLVVSLAGARRRFFSPNRLRWLDNGGSPPTDATQSSFSIPFSPRLSA